MGCRPPGSRCEARCAARRCVPSRVHARALYGSTHSCLVCSKCSLGLVPILGRRHAAPRQPAPRCCEGKQPQKPPLAQEEISGHSAEVAEEITRPNAKITAEGGAQELSPSFLHGPEQAPHPRRRGRSSRRTARTSMTFARFTFALLVGRWRAFPVVFRLVLGPGQGGEASVCGGGASLCSLTPCPGPLAPLPREIPSSEAPSHPSRICARSLRRRLRRGAHDRG